MMDDKIMGIFGIPGGMEWVVIGLVGLLIFGRRLPDVARNIGKSIVEFKKGMRDVKDDIERDQNNGPKRIESMGQTKLDAPPERGTHEAPQPTPAEHSVPAASNEVDTPN